MSATPLILTPAANKPRDVHTCHPSLSVSPLNTPPNIYIYISISIIYLLCCVYRENVKAYVRLLGDLFGGPLYISSCLHVGWSCETATQECASAIPGTRRTCGAGITLIDNIDACV